MRNLLSPGVMASKTTNTAMFSREDERFESNRLDFVRTELELGITFASSALSSKTEEKKQR